MKTARYFILAGLSLLTGCATLELTPVAQETAAGRWVSDQPLAMAEGAEREAMVLPAKRFITPAKATLELESNQPEFRAGWASRLPPLSPGDRLQLMVRDGEEFSGIFEVQLDGSLPIPYLPALQVAGRSSNEVEAMIKYALVQAGYYREGLIQVSLDIHQWSDVEIYVSGAVFVAGRVSVNQRKAEERAEQFNTRGGDAATDRVIESALRAAGGVRPDADLSRVILNRQGSQHLLDLRPLMWGYPVPAIPLMSGDMIHVPSTGVFDEELARPSAITPPGMRVFLSNLTTPAPSNSISGIGKEATSLPYGSRLLTGLVSANCVGGAEPTNSSRKAVIISYNPISGKQEVLARSIEKVLASPHRADLNPLLMPNDAIACYESGAANVRDIARMLTDLLTPFSLGI